MASYDSPSPAMAAIDRDTLRAAVAAFPTFRVGPGRAGSRVKWLSPIPVKMKGPAVVDTVRTVKGRAGS